MTALTCERGEKRRDDEEETARLAADDDEDDDDDDDTTCVVAFESVEGEVAEDKPAGEAGEGAAELHTYTASSSS